MPTKRGVLLLGMGTTALSAFESISERFDVLGLVRSESSDDPCVLLAKELGVPVFPETSVNALHGLVERLRPDCVVVSSYDRILPARLLSAVPFVNVHYSPLPRYRGRANVNWAIINGESEAAISIHEMVPGLDAGGVLFQQRTPIGSRDHVGDVYSTLNSIQRRELGVAVERFLDGHPGEPQDEGQATWGCTRLPVDGLIDWSCSTTTIDRLVRGVSEPFPGAFTYVGRRRLRVWRAEPVDEPRPYDGRIPGRVVARSAVDGWVEILTGDGVLRLIEVQLEGEDRTTAAAVIRSVRMSLGVSLPELVDAVQELETRLAALSEQATLSS